MKQLAVLLVCCLAALSFSTAQAQNSNSLVRFRIYYGSYLLGDIDLELFDHAKPVTVANFLAYVRSDRYQNSFLHRLIPGFIVQGGEWTIHSPYSGDVLERVARVPTFDPITNEFGIGPRLTNSYGTIAMAKLPGDPDSATASWFINLANNGPNLDNQNGGFTVFGRVKAGTRYLEYFNSLEQNNGILDMTSANYTNSCPAVLLEPDGVLDYPFSDLPVQFGFFDCPYYNDLFRVQTIVLSDGDRTAPKIAILSPKPNASVTNEVVISGKVTDAGGMGTVRVYRETNNPVTAILSSNGLWSATLTNVPPGTNIFIAEAVDAAGNLSGVVQRFFYSVLEPLNLQVIGNGTVTGAADDQMLELGRGYTLVAKPDPGHLFSGWTGPVTQSGLSYPFIMETNLVITATFVTNLFPGIKGTYTGLFFNRDEVEQQGSGLLTLTVGDFGSYSARLSMNGKTHSFRGTFSPDGRETNLVTRPGTNDLLLRLALDLDGGTDQLTGSITNNQGLAVNTNFAWSAELEADRNVVRPRDQPATEAGKYTFLLPRDTNTMTGPPGDSFGGVNISTKGVVTFAGSLSDGTKVTQRAALSKNAMWPLYLSLYRGKGALIGWVTVTDETDTDFSGLLNWFKQPQVTARIYPAGFTNEATMQGSRFVAPTPSTRLIDLTDAVVGFTNAVFAADFANEVSIDAAGKVTNQSTNRLTLNISRSTGWFTGSVTPPTIAPPISFKGAILQKQDRGGGFFLNLNSSGAVELREE